MKQTEALALLKKVDRLIASVPYLAKMAYPDLTQAAEEVREDLAAIVKRESETNAKS